MKLFGKAIFILLSLFLRDGYQIQKVVSGVNPQVTPG